MAVPLKIAALSASGLELLAGPPDFCSKLYDGPEGNVFQFDHSGDRLAVCNGTNAILMVAKDDGAQAIGTCSGDSPINFVSFSPTGKYIVTHEKLQGKELTKNLKIWDTSSAVLVAAFSKRGVNEDSWPALQFDAAETHLFFVAKDSIVLYAMNSDFAKATHKLKVESAAQFAVGPGKRKVVASFSPEARGGKPAFALVHEWSEGGTTCNRKSFFRAQRAKIKWNTAGTHVLFQTIADFDATNQSYYGESRLYLLSADGRVDMAVTMENEQAVADVAWSPDSQFFVAIGGVVPATAMLFSQKGKSLTKLVSGAFNTVTWCPHSRFILLAGFGNMPGDIQTFEKMEDNKCERMGATRSECSVLVEWSPCGRYFLTASVAPRMRVDNRVSVFTYYAETLHHQPYEELFAACWQPRPAGLYPDRGQSPERLKAVADGKRQGVNLTAPNKDKGYVPPHLRGRNGSASPVIEGLDVEAAAEMIKKLGSKPRGVLGAEDVPGPPASKSASKNAKRRAKKAAQKEEIPGHSESPGHDELMQTDGNTAGMQVEVTGGPTEIGECGQTEPAKRLRNLRKKHAKLLAAKEKRATLGVAALTPEQVQSIENEPAMLTEMRNLGATDV